MSTEKKDRGGEGRAVDDATWCWVRCPPVDGTQQHLHLAHSSLSSSHLLFSTYHLYAQMDGLFLFSHSWWLVGRLSEEILLSIYVTLSQEKLGCLLSFKKKKTREVLVKLCIALLRSDHLRPDAFLSLRGAVHVTGLVFQSLRCVWLCNPMHRSKLGSSVLHYLPEFAQTYVHWVGDAFWLFHPLPPPSPLAFSLSSIRIFFQWVSPLSQVAEVLELQLQHQVIIKVINITNKIRLANTPVLLL